ncbi:MAG: hypothetical protein ACLQGP_03045, partial [Isosphaeraceae bacterium]
MKPFNRTGRRERSHGRRRAIELGLERCEDRFMLSTTYTVNTNSDDATVGSSDAGSLPYVVNLVNSDPADSGIDTIQFALPANELEIDLASTLTLTHAVLIDGTSQNGYNPADPVPVVTIGEKSGSGAIDGFVLGSVSEGSTIQGLSIVNFGAAAIHVESSGDTIATNYLGVTTNGTNGANQIGVLVDDVGQTTIGGTTTGAANVIGFNTGAGVSIGGSAASNNLVASNWIGTDSQGGSLPNRDGVDIAGGASNNTIGATVSSAGNTIAFNTGDGININSGTGNSIRQNLIYSNTGTAIALSGSADILQPPSDLAYTSVTNLTTIDYTVNGTSGDTYAIDFFAS